MPPVPDTAPRAVDHLRDSAGVVLPSRDDAVVAAASERVGGQAGARVAGAAGWWSPVRVVALLAVLGALAALLVQAPCRSANWSSGVYTYGCYSDISALYFARGLDVDPNPFTPSGDRPVEYPPLTAAFIGVVAAIVHATVADDPSERLRRFADLSMLALLACWVLLTVLTARFARDRPWDAAMVAVAPGIIAAGLVNWDLFAALFPTAAILAWRRDRTLLAGVLLGLGGAAKFYPLLILLPVVLVAWREGRLGAGVRSVLAALAAFAAVNLPAALWAPEQWREFFVLSQERGVGYGSAWYLPFERGWWDPTATLNWLGPALLAAACLGIAWLAWRAPRPVGPRLLAQLAFLVVLAFCLTNKVYSPQYVVWLAALYPLAYPRWGPFLIWQAAEVLYTRAIWLQLLGVTDPGLAIPAWPHSWATVIRLAAQLWVGWLVAREVLRGGPDPAGGLEAEHLVEAGRGHPDVDGEPVADRGRGHVDG